MAEHAAAGRTAATDVRKTAQRLTRRYWLLLVAIAVLATIDQALVQPLLIRLSGHAPVINLAGRQRMLSQQLAKAALALTVSDGEASAEARRRALQVTAAQWSRAHERLTSGQAGPQLARDDAARIAAEFDRLQPHFSAMYTAAKKISLSAAGRVTANHQSAPNRLAPPTLVAAILEHEAAYLPIMDGIVALYEAAAQRQVMRLRIVGLSIMITMWLAVVALGGSVLRPAQHIIERQLALLAESETCLRRARDELEIRVADRTRELLLQTEALQREMAERRRAEAKSRELAAQLARASRVTALGQLATGLAHELNQPLAAITNYAETAAVLLAQRQADPSALREALQRVQQTALRAGKLVDRMRRFLRPSPLLRQPASLAALIGDVCELCRAGSRDSAVEICVEMPDELPEVLVDVIQVQQVLMNLVQNSLQAMHSTARQNAWCRVRVVCDTPQCRVEVHDNGPGFPTGMVTGDFTPFYTSKPDGLGMGLAISSSIIQQHGGRLWATSVAGQGATVSFTLPLAPEPHEDIEHAADGVCGR